MKRKQTGWALWIVTILLLLTVVGYTMEIREQAMDLCPIEGEEECPHTHYIPWQSLLGAFLVLILGGVNFIFTFQGKKEETPQRQRNLEEVASTLQDEEKEIYEFVVSNQGAVLQSKIVKELDFNKVKVSRLLDKLEGKDLIERKRKGITNLVVAK